MSIGLNSNMWTSVCSYMNIFGIFFDTWNKRLKKSIFFFDLIDSLNKLNKSFKFFFTKVIHISYVHI